LIEQAGRELNSNDMIEKSDVFVSIDGTKSRKQRLYMRVINGMSLIDYEGGKKCRYLPMPEFHLFREINKK
jgi:hypothetical protein